MHKRGASLGRGKMELRGRKRKREEGRGEKEEGRRNIEEGEGREVNIAIGWTVGTPRR